MVAISVPIVVSFACETIMTFTDRLFLSRLSAVKMSAAMSGGLLFFAIMSFFLGLIGYVTALSAQYFGAEKKDKCSLVLTQGGLLVLLAYPLLLLLKPVVYKVLASLGIDEMQFVHLKEYLNILMYGSVFVMGRFAVSSFFSGIGKTRYVMFAAFLAMVINIFLNYCLIFGNFGMPELGIQGAAIGTIAASICSFLFLLSVYLQKDNKREYGIAKSFRYSKEIFLKLLHFGYPAGVESLLAMGSFTAIVFLFHMQGSVAANATSILFNWDMVTFVPLLGVEIGVTSLVGRYVGAKDFLSVDKTVRSGLKMGAVYCAIVVAVFLTGSSALADVFSPDVPDAIFTAARPIAVDLLKFVPVYIFANMFMLVFLGALRGAGETFHAMLISIVIHWLLLIVLYICIYPLGMNVVTSWATLIAFYLCVFLLPYIVFKKGKWKAIHVID